MKLYLYQHCPFCVRAQMIFGLRNIAYEEVVLLNDDEATPIGLIGKKMLPILQLDDGRPMAESLDIVHYIDSFHGQALLAGPRNPSIQTWLERASGSIFCLAIPRWAQSPLSEFDTASARACFVQNKTRILGSFRPYLANTPQLIAAVQRDLKDLAEMLVPGQGCNGMLSMDDILLYPLLRALSIVAGIEYPPAIEHYRRHIAIRANVPLHDAIAL